MKTDLTIAICVYNAEKYIEETLISLIHQTKQDFNLIFVDDNSPDKSIEIIERFFNKNPRQFEIIHFNENKGLAAGRKYIENYVSTKYLLFIDADDKPYDKFVEKLYKKIISDNDLMAVGCYLEYINLDGSKRKGGIFIGETTKEGFINKAKKNKLIFMPSTSIYDREIALSVGGHCISGFPEGKPRYQDFCEDLDLWTRMSDLYVENKAIIVIPEVLYQYRKGDGMSYNTEGMLLRMRQIKNNLRRRRSGLHDLSFIEFTKQLRPDQKIKIKKEAISADSLRKAYYQIKRFHLISGIYNLLKCIRYNPSYLFDKIKYNFIRLH